MNNAFNDHELLNAWQKVIAEFTHLPEIEAFQQAEAKIEKHETIQHLREQIKLEQKALVNAQHYEKRVAVQQHQIQIASLEAELELIPLWHQYQELKQETNDLIQAMIAGVETLFSE
ncbi:MAG: YlbF family regulator [Culicoidibacterales bacterium]